MLGEEEISRTDLDLEEVCMFKGGSFVNSGVSWATDTTQSWSGESRCKSFAMLPSSSTGLWFHLPSHLITRPSSLVVCKVRWGEKKLTENKSGYFSSLPSWSINGNRKWFFLSGSIPSSEYAEKIQSLVLFFYDNFLLHFVQKQSKNLDALK